MSMDADTFNQVLPQIKDVLSKRMQVHMTMAEQLVLNGDITADQCIASLSAIVEVDRLSKEFDRLSKMLLNAEGY